MDNEFEVHALDGAVGDNFYLVETPTQYIVYENLYNKVLRTKKWKGLKKEIPTAEDAIVIWLTSLN